ncbi:MAG: hypothetical protein BJ554DRAFT_2859 [Olpidium bornovanus]|uniref:Uncharacterized protein n=1 Tax=Olpidium bornovanus TaxID=278681 RepID=A0A8H8DFZ5_9FUNG|nr:MAG: hypothetical protein BJ554DRAFT_2859 [Olpidium bornovanus]
MAEQKARSSRRRTAAVMSKPMLACSLMQMLMGVRNYSVCSCLYSHIFSYTAKFKKGLFLSFQVGC